MIKGDDGDWARFAESDDSRAVELLIAALGKSDWEVRVTAIDALGQVGDPRIVEPLIKALGDGDEDVRWAAIEALGQLGDARAVEALIKALRDSDEDVRCAATEALGRLGDEGVSHFVNEPVANALARRYPLAAAKIHLALAMRVVVAGKSKYYTYALEHLEQAKKLYEKNGQNESWQSLVERVREDHSRKYSFIGSFEAIVAGERTQSHGSFEKRMRTKWKKQASK